MSQESNMPPCSNPYDLKIGKNIFMKEPIAVIGLGCVLPGGIGISNFWNFLQRKGSAIREISKDRWDPDIYYSPDKSTPDKTYCKIGAFVENVEFDATKFRIPPNIAQRIDLMQQWSLIAAQEALEDAGYGANKEFDRSRVAVIMANAMGGEIRDDTILRVQFLQIADIIKKYDTGGLSEQDRQGVIDEVYRKQLDKIPSITEDSMPGELSNIVSGRIANRFDLKGTSYTTDAACASAFAALEGSIKGLQRHDFDLAVVGAVDRSMNPATFVKFCKIGALSPDLSCPFDARANGFVMGEGATVYILKRLSEAVRDGNRIYALITGIGSSSDGKGKGITAPNPVGQRLAIQRALNDAGYTPEMIELIEAHGTSTIVGDEVEANTLIDVWKNANVGKNQIGIGSVKSNIGHLKSGAGGPSLIKVALSLYNKKKVPSIHYEQPNPKFDLKNSPFHVITEVEDWKHNAPYPRRAGISSFGFGGTNFHMVMEEYDPDYARRNYIEPLEAAQKGLLCGPAQAFAEAQAPPAMSQAKQAVHLDEAGLNAYRTKFATSETEMFIICADTPEALSKEALDLSAKLEPMDKPFSTPRLKDLAYAYNIKASKKKMRLVVTGITGAEIASKIKKSLPQLANPAAVSMMANQGVFFNPSVSKTPMGKIGFLFPGQGSQYANMLRDLKERYKIVQETFDEADSVMVKYLPKPLSDYIYIDESSPEAVKSAENSLKQTEITQPAMITGDIAIFKLLKSYGIKPDVVIGHSLGEYGALVAAGILDIKDCLVAVSARGREMASITQTVPDMGKMVSVSADTKTVEKILKDVKGYAIPANKNCNTQTVVGGDTPGVAEAVALFTRHGIQTQYLPVSAAFHSKIVAPAEKPLRQFLEKLTINPPNIEILSNVTGDYYPTTGDVKTAILDLLEKQVSSPVEFQKEVERMYTSGVRVFIEVGPKRALAGFVDNILEGRPHVALITNHPKKGGVVHWMECLGALAAMGMDLDLKRPDDPTVYGERFLDPQKAFSKTVEMLVVQPAPATQLTVGSDETRELIELGRKAKKMGVYLGHVGVTGVSLGLPGKFKRVFDEKNADLVLSGVNLIDPIDKEYRKKFLDKNIVKLVKEADGRAHFEVITDDSQVLKLAGQAGRFDLTEEYGIDKELVDNLDTSSQLAMAAGIEALRDAGIPLVRRYRKTTMGTFLPEDWELPKEMQEDTGVIFPTTFAGIDKFSGYLADYFAYKYKGKVKDSLIAVFTKVIERVKDAQAKKEMSDWFAKTISELGMEIGKDEVFKLNRKFMFNMLSIGHAQFAQLIKAKGPNVHNNAACSTTTQAVGIAEDLIRTGRCKRVVLISGDNPTSHNNLEWLGSSLLAVGAASVEENVENAALPFDLRRNGLIIGMGAIGMVLEREEDVHSRGMEFIVEIMGSYFCNSAFHGSNLDPPHIATQMDKFWKIVERKHGISRYDVAKDTVFISHETYTPARGGSASGEAKALQATFKDKYRDVVVSNTKGFTGHAFGACIEDGIAIKALQKGKIPPIANYKVPDPDLGDINLSKGQNHYFKYALRLAAGFGSQLAFVLYRSVSTDERRIMDPKLYQQWLLQISKQNTAELEVVNRTLRIKDDGTFLKRREMVERVKPPTAPVQKIPGVVTAKDAIPALDQLATLTIDREAIAVLIKGMVEKKTGYKTDMIQKDLDFESDMGIDSVKQMDIFNSLREQFKLPEEEGLKINDYRTVDDIVNYIAGRLEAAIKIMSMVTVTENGNSLSPKPQTGAISSATPTMPLPKQATMPMPAPSPAPMPAKTTESYQTGTQATACVGKEEIMAKVIEVITQKTGYPKDMLEPGLDMEADLGIDTVKQVEIFQTIRDAYGLEREEGIKLSDYPTIQAVVDYIDRRLQGSPASTRRSAAVEASNAVQSAAPRSPSYAAPMQMPSPKPAMSAPSSPSATSQPSQGGGVGRDEVMAKVVDIITQKTGYPKDMLEPGLDMEADLGIDTVKQVEIFQTIRDAYGLEREEGIKLSDYPTIQAVVDYIYKRLDGRPGAASPITSPAASVGRSQAAQQMPRPAAPMPSASPLPQPSPAARPPPAIGTTAPAGAVTKDEVMAKVLDVISQKTGYPKDMLEPGLDMEADLGIDTVKQVEIFQTIREAYGLEREEGIKLSDYPTIQAVVDYIGRRLSSQQGVARPSVAPTSGIAIPASPAPTAASAPPAPKAPAPRAPSQPKAKPAPPAGAADKDEVMARVLDIIAQKTGYPKEMLDPGLDMEADLGIDTVKQVEIFQTIRDSYGLEREEGIKLSDYPTIQAVVGYISKRLESSAPGHSASAPVAGAKPAAPTDKAEDEAKRLRRYALRLVPSEARLATKRFDLKGKGVVLVADEKGVYKKLKAGLEAEGAKVAVIRYSSGPKAPPKEEFVGYLDKDYELEPIIKNVRATIGPVRGVIDLVALDDEPVMDKMDMEQWKALTAKKVKSVFAVAKQLRSDLEAGVKEGVSFFACVSATGGSFGIESWEMPTPVCGGVFGITKAIGKELPETLVKMIDLSEAKPDKAANIILDELLYGDPQLEVAYKKGVRHVTRMGHSPLDEASKPRFSPDKDWVFVVTGGGFGITAEITKDMCKAWSPHVHIIDIVKMPQDIERIAALDEKGMEGLKDHLKEEIKARGEKLTPVILEKEFKRYTAPRTIFQNIQSMKSLGADVEYHSCDVTDHEGMKKVLDEIRKKHKRIDVIVHAAGVEISKAIQDKPYDQFAFVFDVKANGAFNLFELTKGDKVKAHVTFASVAGRFGNIGQTDYSAANDLLNKYCALNNKRYKKGFKAISLNWTGWRDVGMATRGSLLEIFDKAGVTLIPTKAGAPMVRANLLFSGPESEVTVAGDVGFLDVDKIITHTPVTPEFLEMEKRLLANRARYTLIDRITELEGNRAVFLKRLDTRTDLYLSDHAIEGTPLLPGVMGVEAFTQAASLLFPDLNVVALEDVKFISPIKLLRGKPLDVRIQATVTKDEKKAKAVYVIIESDFINPQGVKMGAPRMHFTGTVRLEPKKQRPKSAGDFKVPGAKDPRIGFKEVYDRFFHGPTFQVLDSIPKLGEGASVAAFHEPEGRFFAYIDSPAFVSTPMFRESAFQHAGMYHLYNTGEMSLPLGIKKVEIFTTTDDKMASSRVVFKGLDKEGATHFDVEILNSKGEVIDRMEDYSMIITGKVPEDKRFRK